METIKRWRIHDNIPGNDPALSDKPVRMEMIKRWRAPACRAIRYNPDGGDPHITKKRLGFDFLINSLCPGLNCGHFLVGKYQFCQEQCDCFISYYNMVCSALFLQRALYTVHCTNIMHSRKPSFVITPAVLINTVNRYFVIYAAMKFATFYWNKFICLPLI